MRLLYLIAMLCSLALPARADVLIDDFTSGPYSVFLSSAQPNASASNQQIGTMLGGTRDTIFQVQSTVNPPGAPPIFGGLSIGSGLFDFALGGSLTRLDVTYSPANVDLSKQDRFRFDFAGNSGLITIGTVVSSFAGVSQTAFTVAPSSNAFFFDIPFSAFVPLGTAADLSAVTFINFNFITSGQAGGQAFKLNSIVAVPEPGTWTAFIAGLLFTGFVGMRRRMHS
jgi:hypothetical protein